VFEVGKDELFKFGIFFHFLIGEVFLSDTLHGVVLSFAFIFLSIQMY
jgi:hypothetical protein